MKNPNGYGSVVKLSGNRRITYSARKTTDWNDNGLPIYKAIGYFPDRNSAMIALAEYNRSPYDIDLSKITLKELFERWSTRDFPEMSKSAIGAFNSAFKKAEILYNTSYKNIKAFQMQEVIDGYGRGTQPNGQSRTSLIVLALSLLNLT